MLLNYQKGLSLQWRLYRQTCPLLNNRKGEGGICLFRGYEEKSMANDYSIWERGDAEKKACAQLWQLANYCNYVLTCVGLLSPISKGTENTNAWKQNFHSICVCCICTNILDVGTCSPLYVGTCSPLYIVLYILALIVYHTLFSLPLTPKKLLPSFGFFF